MEPREPAVNANAYLLNTKSILFAGTLLLNNLGKAPLRLEHAVTQLEQAADQHASSGTTYRSFMFTEMETARDSGAEAKSERVMEDTLAGILVELQVANLLLAAGQALGEAGGQANPDLLKGALRELESTVKVVAPAISQPLEAPLELGRFRFAAESASPQVARPAAPPAATPKIESADVSTAIDTFRSTLDATLNAVVSDAQKVVNSAVTSLAKIDPAQVLDALSKLGAQVQQLDKLGRLFRKGLEKLNSVLDFLFNLLGNEVLDKARDYVARVWEDIKQGKRVAGVLEWAFDVEATRSHGLKLPEELEDRLAHDTLDRAGPEAKQLTGKLDNASTELKQLAVKFGESMELGEGIITTVTVAGGILALIPLAGPKVALVVASTYVLVLATVLLIGMDYTDASRLLKRVRGVRQISDSMRSA